MTIRRLMLALLVFSGLAHGQPQLNRTQLLQRVPGQVLVETPQATPTQRNITIRADRLDVKVHASLGITGNQGEAVNSAVLWVDNPNASRAERTALTVVAQTIITQCVPDVPAAAQAWLRRLPSQRWTLERGSQHRQFEALQLSWSGKQGLRMMGTEVSGITLKWQGPQGRCRL